MSASCRVVRRHLDALVDGELDGNVQVDFETHLAGCPICREHAAFSKAVKTTVKEELGSVRAPEHLRLRVLTAIQSAVPPGGRPRPPVDPHAASPGGAEAEDAEGAYDVHPGQGSRAQGRSRVRVWMLPARYAVPAAAAAVLVIALGARTDDSDSDEAAMAVASVPLLEDVVRRHSSEHPAEVEGPPQQVVGWFRGKLEFPVRPVEFDHRQHVRFMGARISNVRDRDAAAFYYEVHGHRVTVMVFEPPQHMLHGVETVNVHGRVLSYRRVHGYTVPVVQHDGLTYAFTGDLDSQAMIQLAASARVAQ